MSGRCGCVDPVITGCQCATASSATITKSGTGSSLDPYIYNANVSADADNRLEVVSDGLKVAQLPYLRSYTSADQDRSSGDALEFDTNDHGDGSIHSTSPTGTARFFFVITVTGLWRMLAQASCADDNHIAGLSLEWQYDTGVELDQNGGGGGVSTPCAIKAQAVEWLGAGTHVQVAVGWGSGSGPAAVSGGIARTWAFLECVATS